MKVKIRKWTGVATWRWDIPDDDVCGICQVHFDGTCPTCKYPGDDCSLQLKESSIASSNGSSRTLQRVSAQCADRNSSGLILRRPRRLHHDEE
ncbi:anaphase-promoting complex subunit 11 [Diplocarpon mali]|nr:anaphase-promoting complex subunit 11 [Diplocarpon mali]